MSRYVVIAPSSARIPETPHFQVRFNQYWVVDDQEAIRMKAQYDDVKVLEDTSGYLTGPIYLADREIEADTRYLRSNTRLTKEVLDAVLALCGEDTWTTEAEIAKVVSLTPYEWRALADHEYFKVGLRKSGLSYRLSKKGAWEKASRERARKFEAQMAKDEAERERWWAEHEQWIERHDRVLAAVERRKAGTATKEDAEVIAEWLAWYDKEKADGESG